MAMSWFGGVSAVSGRPYECLTHGFVLKRRLVGIFIVVDVCCCFPLSVVYRSFQLSSLLYLARPFKYCRPVTWPQRAELDTVSRDAGPVSELGNF